VKGGVPRKVAESIGTNKIEANLNKSPYSKKKMIHQEARKRRFETPQREDVIFLGGGGEKTRPRGTGGDEYEGRKSSLENQIQKAGRGKCLKNLSVCMRKGRLQDGELPSHEKILTKSRVSSWEGNTMEG